MPNFYENPQLQKKANKTLAEGGKFPTRKETIKANNKPKKGGMSSLPPDYSAQEKFYASEGYQKGVKKAIANNESLPKYKEKWFKRNEVSQKEAPPYFDFKKYSAVIGVS